MDVRAHRRFGTRGTISVTVVLALAGLLFAANARQAQGSGTRTAQDLPGLVGGEEDRVAQLTGQVATLRAEVTALSAREAELAGVPLPTATLDERVAAGTVPVTGPGLEVTLDDAPRGLAHDSSVHPDDLVVHEQDLQAVVNALWSGGAEGVSLMDQRLVGTSSFRCIGNVLALGGRRYSPPYVVRAVGDPDRMRRALLASPAVDVYLQYVDAVGLGWQVERVDSLDLPADEAAGELHLARLPAGVDPVTGKAAS